MKFYLKKNEIPITRKFNFKNNFGKPRLFGFRKSFLLGTSDTIGFPKQNLNLKNRNWVIISYSDLIWLNITFATSV
jgi:hypothetical protein